jgi:ferredoxin
MCVMTVLQGAETLEPPSDRETSVLARNDAAPGQRLGCQCRMPTDGADLLITTGYW